MKTSAEKGVKKKRFRGVVTSVAMTDTAVVQVDQYYKHPRYGKYVRTNKKLKAHDPGNTKQVGELVEIEETRPLSKSKKFRVL